ncbi:unnamed protein product, partial [Meganyctiphanes norvegica]
TNMAAFARRLCKDIPKCGRYGHCVRTFTTENASKQALKNQRLCLYGIGAATGLFCGLKWLEKNAIVEAARPRRRTQQEEAALRGLKLNHRERRFIKFSSVEYSGQLYMTPQDFIESVTDSEPRTRVRRRVLRDKDLEAFHQETPALNKGSPTMFRTVYDKGIISYTEYLFLLSILTKPQTGFRIAFNMFDTDGNERVDKNEFLVLTRLLAKSVVRDFDLWVSHEVKHSHHKEISEKNLSDTREVLEKIFSEARRDRLNRALEGIVKTDTEAEEKVMRSKTILKNILYKVAIFHLHMLFLNVYFSVARSKEDIFFDFWIKNIKCHVLNIIYVFLNSTAIDTDTEGGRVTIRQLHIYSQLNGYKEMSGGTLISLRPRSGGLDPELGPFCAIMRTLSISIGFLAFCVRILIAFEILGGSLLMCTTNDSGLRITAPITLPITHDSGGGMMLLRVTTPPDAALRSRLHHTSRGSWWALPRIRGEA